jgi:tellurite resistance protein
MGKTADNLQPFIAKLVNRLPALFEKIITEKKQYYLYNKPPEPEELKSVIKKYSLLNASIAAGSSMMPTPISIIALVPELISVTNNQIKMLIDIAAAYDKHPLLSKDLLMSVLCYADGLDTPLFTTQDNRILFPRFSASMSENLAFNIARQIGIRLGKSSVLRFIPVLGSIALGYWVQLYTARLGQSGSLFFQKKIEFTDKSIGALPLIDLEEEKKAKIEFERALALINLMKIDGKVDKRELQFVQKIINELHFSPIQRSELAELIRSPQIAPVNSALIKIDTGEALATLVDMVVLSQKDGEVDKEEKKYIFQMGKELDFSLADIDSLFA